MNNKIYLCIDLKSFYASVECVERGLDPFKINLVVADPTRGGGAITLAATPAIKKLGVPSRGRIYEIPKNIEYITAPPRMTLYMKYSATIYSIFLKFISSEDIHVYSIDESFLDITTYMSLYNTTPKQLAKMILDEIYDQTGITATVGIGTNLFLAKVALDITAKHAKDCMGYLDEDLFKQLIWHHQPITDIWMIGPGTANRLEMLGIEDLYGVAHYNEKILYKLFGINAEYLIDHSWGREPTEISDIKAYKPSSNSISNSQILFEDYNYKDAYLIMKEMVESNVLQLTEKHLVTNHISLFIGYSKNCIKPSRGSRKITNTTNSYRILLEEFKLLYKNIINPNYPIRQIGISFGNVKDEIYEQFDLFADQEDIEKEKRVQEALVHIRNKYGKNAVLKGMNFYDKATQRKRNGLVGGHNA
ncbi:DNA repair protein [Massilicoli timonensis]|uniref:DNA repair protein n=1 Tax=Massilicoli timonensis TaxID=2015901 RepID=A0ABT1SJ26_9FIRM|nr:DNA repair protein [Massilicoli timonensis]MCQ5121236.1 DNA repair protein [Massilicoli timonensis]